MLSTMNFKCKQYSNLKFLTNKLDYQRSSEKMSRGGPPNRGRGSRGRKRFGDNGFAEWGGYMNAKKTKLEEQFSKEASKECQDSKLGIFHNVAIFVNGYTGEC